jgi:serine/threonine protein kinase
VPGYDARYELGDQLGSGAWFTVHAARDVVDERTVVVKVIHDFLCHDETFTAGLREVLARMVKLTHPNLVEVLDHGDGWSVEEGVSGRSLGSWLRQDATALALGPTVTAAVLEALDAVHDEGLVHGCIHPNAIRMSTAGQPKLGDVGYLSADPGLVGPFGAKTMDYHKTYLAPEIRRGQRPSPLTDVYGAGLVLAMCLRNAPAGQEHPGWLARARDVAARATMIRPQDRFQSVADMTVAVRDLL